MTGAAMDYLRECGRMLKWVFFQPSKLNAYIEQIAPGQADKKGWRNLMQAIMQNALLRRLLVQALLVTVVLPFVIDPIAGLVIIAAGFNFNWTKGLYGVGFGIAVGIAFGIALGIVRSFGAGTLGTAVGIAGSIAFGIVGSIAFGTSGDAAFGVAFGVTLCIAVGVLFSVADGIASGIAFNVWFGVGLGVVGVVAVVVTAVVAGLAAGDVVEVVAGGVAIGIGVLRLPFYTADLIAALLAHRHSQIANNPEMELKTSPVYFDELLVLPQPYLTSLLLRVSEENQEAGLRQLARVACNPFQSWASQKALRNLLENKEWSFFNTLNWLLSSPAPYHQVGNHWIERVLSDDRYSTTKLLLAEVAGVQPIPSEKDQWWGYGFARWATMWLRKGGQSPFAPIAKAYFDLLSVAWELDGDDEKQTDGRLERLTTLTGSTIAALAALRSHANGEEFFRAFRLIESGLRCEGLPQVNKLRDEFTPLFEIKNPLRPQIIRVFRCLRDAAVDAASFLTAEHELTRRDALLKAGGVLEEARQLANEVYEPERSLLLAVIEHWRRMFAVEGGRVAEKQEVEVLPNPYVAGRPIRPEDGRLFTGRREEMKLIEEKLQTGVGLVIWGQRRIGKTSILLHLRERLPHDLLPVYLNLQMLMANTTGGFLHAIAREIVKQFNSSSPIQISPAAEFDREPFLTLNRVLEEVEQRLQPGQRVLLSFDEFEELEQRVKGGKIEKEIFAYLRGVTQTGRGFALMFAGLHTLEEMTREYWNPFFQSVQTIRIGYLSELDAEQLIRDPVERFPLDYELEAVNRITELTRSHPYLTQSLCHSLVNRLNDPLHRSRKATRQDVDAVVERTLESSGYYFDDYVWGWSGADEQLALALLAEASEEAGDEVAFSVVEKHLGSEAALVATKKLVSREILTERTLAEKLVFRFQIPLARLWVRRTKSSARLLLERGV
ncbi:MAG TPA: hypothetical protein PLQ88_02135 [Blastocatellia bacterium]|nr:hypothetical protein [Blastocatellia bacterium]